MAQEPSADDRPRPAQLVIRPIVSDQRIQVMARQAARLQGVSVADARAPAAVMTAVRELHQIAGLAAGVLLRRPNAARVFQQRLAATSPVGRTGGPSGRGPSAARALASLAATASGSGICSGRFPPMRQVLEAAFVLDVREGRGNATNTLLAGEYLRERAATVDQYEGGLAGGGRGLGDPTDPVLPPDMGIPPPDVGDAPEPEPDTCTDVSDLCATLFEQSLAALAADSYVDLIATVTPDCVCSNYPADQVFVGRPAAGREFPVPLPTGVGLYFRGVDITSRITTLAKDEVHFTIPPGSSTGFVYFRGPLPLDGPANGVGGGAARLCGVTAPPDFPAYAEQGPAARISIIWPPVVDILAADGRPGPEVEAEACAPVELCWRARLEDQPAHLPLPPCAAIAVEVRDSAGSVVAQGGAQGCAVVRHGADETFTAVARSFAGPNECGTSPPLALTIQRTARLHLTAENPPGVELLAGSAGTFLVEASCPAGGEGLRVDLTVNRRDQLGLPPSVTIPAGLTFARVIFTVEDTACGPVEIRASAAGHVAARLRYDILRAPKLDWAITDHMPYAPPRARAFAPFTFTIKADCVPEPERRMTWRLVRTDAGGQGEELPLTVYRPGPGILQQYPLANWLFVSPTRPPGSGPPSPTDPIPGLVLGTWAIVADIADVGLTSNLLEFDVDLCDVDIFLESVAVGGSESRFEGALELYMTAVVEPEPPPVPGLGSFLPTSTSLRWPPYPAKFRKIDVGQTVTLQARITGFTVTAGSPVAARVRLTIHESDSFLLFGDDTEVASGTLTVSCETENRLDFRVEFGEEISVSGCATDPMTGQTVCSTPAGPATVRVGFTAIPRPGP